MQRRSLIGLGLMAAALPRAALAAPAPWRTIFDGRSLKGWTPRGEANWALKDGAVQADNEKIGFLVSDETFGDVRIRAEFWATEDANSGIFIRCTNPFNVTTQTGYEVNIYDRRPDPTYGTGGIVGLAKVTPDMPKAGGHWNVMDITAKGDSFTVVLNGVRTVDNVRNGDHSHGRIALQYGLGTVKFRKVQVRPI